MIQCPKCSAENPSDNKFCGSCAEPLSSLSQMPTVEVPEGEAPPSPVNAPHVGRLISSDSVPAGGFTPGTILADRYRIIGLLGRGGMGEVYRADDLKLGQPVALKFLPPKLAEDSVRRERFFAEVRITRQLSHPNICRVYDIGDIEGRHFLSMEYIDGEDLASLMKRIGHLSNEKALDIARQLVAGLSVAHERGVLHRDLKPANIMLDGHGRVRITDFGLAIAAEDEAQAAEIAGTPAYMAPEQLAGKGATVRSDIYSLGLILYEIYTGKKAFTARTLAELREQKETQTPRAPSEIREGIDPVVERVIQRCMEKDPGSRPASVAQLAQALPGGDPLAAAIAAGETPSPEMVAASGSTEGLKPWIAWLCLAGIILGIGIGVIYRWEFHILNLVPIEREPAVLEQTARDLLRDLGYSDDPVDKAYDFIYADRFLSAYLEKTRKSPGQVQKIPAMAIQFWYRQSPDILFTRSPITTKVTLSDPPFAVGGESIVFLDSQGHLTGLQVIPPTGVAFSGDAPLPNWSILFRAAGLNEVEFNKTQPEWIPPVYADTRAAWIGTLPGFQDMTVRIEAAACQGKAVSWRMIFPEYDNYSTASLPTMDPAQSATGPATATLFVVFFILLIAGSVFFARRNLRVGRGDRRGATRLAMFVFLLQTVSWVFGEHHVPSHHEILLFLFSAAWWLLVAGLLWLIYIALEPFARRRWPRAMVGWNRLLAGNYRDPLIGRDLLVGCASATILVVLIICSALFQNILGGTMVIPTTNLGLLSGFSSIFSAILSCIFLSIFFGFVAAFFIFMLQVLLKRTWVAVTVTALLSTAIIFAIQPPFLAITIAIALSVVLTVFLFLRYGLLALIAFIQFGFIWLNFPFGAPLSTWYFKIGLTGLALLLVFALYAFYTSLGGRPLFGTPRLED